MRLITPVLSSPTCPSWCIPDWLRCSPTPFLQGMSHRHVEILASCACRTRFNEGQTIFREGETANRFYLIEEGAVELLAATKSGARRIVAGSIGPGGVLGWSWLFPPYNGSLPPALHGKQARSFFTQRSCASIARRIHRSALSYSSEWPRKW